MADTADPFEQFPREIQTFMRGFFRHQPHVAELSNHGPQNSASTITPGQEILSQAGLNSDAQRRANAVLVANTGPIKDWSDRNGSQERGVAALIITALGVASVAAVLMFNSCGNDEQGLPAGDNTPSQTAGNECIGERATDDDKENRRELQKKQDTRVLVCDPVTGKLIGVCVAFGYREYNPDTFQPATLREAASYVDGYNNDTVRKHCLGENNNVVAWMNERLKVSEPIIEDLPVAIPVTIRLEQ